MPKRVDTIQYNATLNQFEDWPRKSKLDNNIDYPATVLKENELLEGYVALTRAGSTFYAVGFLDASNTKSLSRLFLELTQKSFTQGPLIYGKETNDRFMSKGLAKMLTSVLLGMYKQKSTADKVYGLIAPGNLGSFKSRAFAVDPVTNKPMLTTFNSKRAIMHNGEPHWLVVTHLNIESSFDEAQAAFEDFSNASSKVN